MGGQAAKFGRQHLRASQGGPFDIIEFVHDRTKEQAQQQRKNLSLKRTKPAPLPTYGLI